MREQPRISEEGLRACLLDDYAIRPASIEFLPIGLDYHAGVYRVMSERGTPYFLKVKSGALNEPAYLVPGYLREQGIASIVAPLPTRDGAMWTGVEGWNVIVYPFIEGDTNWTGMTDEQWREVGSIFKRIHQAALPPFGFEALRRETFDPTGYVRWIETFEDQQVQAHNEESDAKRALRAAWQAHQPAMHHVIASLRKLAGVLQSRTLPYVICHADLHPANLLRDPTGRVWVIDWDEVMLAPKERDFLFVRESSDDSETLPGAPAFFQGYGQVRIDRTALTYYRYERAVQDLIACAEEVFFRDDLGEETKADSVRLFQSTLMAVGEIEAASAMKHP